MHLIRSVLIGLGSLTSSVLLYETAFSTEITSPDLSAQLQAVEQMALTPAAEVPRTGQFYSAKMANAGLIFAPILPGGMGLDAWNLGDNVWLVNDLETVTPLRNGMRRMAMDGGPLPPGAGGGATNTYTFNGVSFDTNQLWVSVAGVGNGQVQANLHHATNFVYVIRGAEDVATPFSAWRIETEVFPADTNCQPFTVATLGRPALFLRAEDFSGVDSDADGVPDWWAWRYWATTNVPTGTDFYNGNPFAEDYADDLAPTVFQFTGIEVTNHYVSSSSVPVQLDVAGYPYYAAVQVDDTNTAAAVWNPYVSSNLTVNLGLTEGWHDVWAGLRGHGDDPMLGVWQWQRVRLDTTPPALVITSPAGGTVSTPVIQLAGYGSEPLSSLTYDVSNAAGIFTHQAGNLTGQYYDTGLQAGTTNYFQCYDVPLAEGLNTVTIHATDLAGNSTASTNQYTLDYAGDHVAPALSLVWPADGAYIDGGSFTLSAQVDDATASVLASIVDGSGHTNTVKGLVKRNGQVQVKDLPLAAGDSRVTVVATDAAGNHSTTNLQVTRQDVGLVIHPLAGDQLNQASVTVSGTAAIGYAVTVNGLAATADGTNWSVAGVPVNSVGTASLQAQASDGGQTVSQALNQEQPSLVRVSSFIQDFYFWGSGACGIHPNTGHEITIWQAGIGGTNSDLSTGNNPYYNEYYLPPDISPVTDWEYQSSKSHTRKHYDASECGPDGYIDEEFETDEIHTFIQLVVGDAGAGGNRQPVRLLLSAWDEDGNPLPVSAIRLGGLTPVPTATNADVGELIVSLPAGSTNDVTPTIAGAEHYFFTVQAQDLALQLAVDNDRDGEITFDTADQTAPENPFRFWVNNDYDGYNSDITDYTDLDPATGNDAGHTAIPNTRDLEDYARLWLNTEGLTEELQNGTYLLGLEWKNVTDDPQMQFFQAVETNGGALYLTDTNVAAQQVSLAGLHVIEYSHRNVLDQYHPFIFPTNFWAGLSAGQPVAHLLFDAVGRGSGQLVISIYKNDGETKLAESRPLYMKLQDVKEMYNRYTVGENPAVAPATTASLASGYAYDTSIPAENNYILLVHGWNLATWEKDAFAETAFKRLYWQGYKGRFGEFRWPTGYGFGGGAWDAITDSRNFDNSESNAWASATGLLGLLSGLNGAYPGHVYLMAHSMGNVVAGEALRQAGSTQVVNTYVAMQAAIAAHTYNPNTTIRTIPFIYEDGTPNRYAAYPTNGGACYFNGAAGAGMYVNFYNTNDYALDKWTLDQNFKPDDAIGYSAAYGYSSESGFYKNISGNIYDLNFPTNTYELFAYAVEARCFALGAQADVGGRFTGNQVDLFSAPYDFGREHKDHSGEFNSDNMNRWSFWDSVLGNFGITR